MKLSTKGRYGVRAMVDLAINYSESPVSIKSIAGRQNISELYLEQLFSPLRKAKLIKSVRGAQGGYVLSKHPKEISVSDIIDVLEGPIEISSCIDSGECNNMEVCPSRLLWEKIKNSIDEVTKSITLQDMANDYKRLKNRSVKNG
ncbi:Rrf2 family transcriptional regulator [Clostridium botulinum C]|uniref:Rrf2 family transcriptional regulator n=3 Tax=Clostridium botulinum TaxID=1491 RepID=A0A9Q4TH20_CLOBO|nr:MULTISPECIES: Rrf2 family transcriptional regulator [Clostridium]AYF54716.1 Rrf2 family transcriptional regulator [Clostridium novyi]EES91394.1 iron-sulfur cluster assembly transcription factor IscR [Clostridium botulinum D str. 1873]KEI10302.1 transcriptional regulator [Clostridium sp. K25]MBO3441775.1 Rrf2 family transcriptional regulator [Clostridium haemolyticum]MCD3194441.1 Rrf2 family transcriptional regulator [Clostridium botulinum C]